MPDAIPVATTSPVASGTSRLTSRAAPKPPTTLFIAATIAAMVKKPPSSSPLRSGMASIALPGRTSPPTTRKYAAASGSSSRLGLHIQDAAKAQQVLHARRNQPHHREDTQDEHGWDCHRCDHKEAVRRLD
jgi:hypothetical protein